ncbi:hypothetical protein M409DRAFT_23460 [Zasmidium cellare ATCC 36951]|uniref:Heterokaryon incompatibility domain-containing protein n=1 Tax=Zasmidium cellare ATCC 36951 TaxID=1080233 RepID=A0A6A6CJA3_ZASCE|nr:uncharacterized protein M409DRAFT_23460 [Zasmidium cellare ATCC 36951]KAF2166268.1 hypothetical protein M409DRAFT_23460 [Zasmidium cellare ATCC 36951]
MQGLTYQPLKPGKSFRLATLHGGQPNDQISLTVQEYDLKNCPPYIALSYEWGEEHEKKISLNGMPFRIRTNLYDFLQVIRPGPSKTRLLFIDALCINQTDVAERSSQVHLMRDIYEGARKVWAWLGRDSVASDVVADACQGQQATDVDDAELQRSAKEVLSRRYWTRMWMMSELMIAKTITLYCGPRSFSWDELVEVLSSYIPDWYHTFESTKAFRAVEDVRAAVRKGSKIPVLRLFDEFGQMECQHKQDRVYSLLAFHAHARRLPCVMADYAGSAEKVFVEALRYCAQAPGKVAGTRPGFEIAKCSRAFQASLGIEPEKSISDVLEVMKEHPSTETLHKPVFRESLEEPQMLGKTKTGAWFETESRSAGLDLTRIAVHAHRYTKTEMVFTSKDARHGDQVFRIRGSAIAVVCHGSRSSWRIVSLGVVVPKAKEIKHKYADFLYHSLDGSVEVDAAGDASVSLSCFDVAVLSSLPEATRS